MPDGHCDRGLADAARADHGHEAMERKPVRYFLDDLLASDHLCERRWKGARTDDFGGGRDDRRGSLREGGDEAIAATRHIDHITGSFAGIAERLAQRCDMEAQTALVDIDVGPDALDQHSLVDDFTGAPGEKDQNIQRAAAEMQRRAILLQEPGPWKQPEWSK
ncbi:hypothetical protein ACVWXO_005846 [Bradyrhizobium sp. LM2.7]